MRRRTKFGLFLGALAIVAGILACIPVKIPSGKLPILGLKLGPETTVVTEPLNELGFPDYVSVVDRTSTPSATMARMTQAFSNPAPPTTSPFI